MTTTDPIYDERFVPEYELPDPLLFDDGSRVSDAAKWKERRTEILKNFQTAVYGHTPTESPHCQIHQRSSPTSIFDGNAIRMDVRLQWEEQDRTAGMDLLIFLPTAGSRPKPLFVGLNFDGNHAVDPDPTIPISPAIAASGKEGERVRGSKASRWPIWNLIKRGYGVATAFCGDLAIDNEADWQRGVYSIFDEPAVRRPDAWGAIGVWAWGLSRAMDYFESDKQIDHQRVAVLGHSRLGKTALWAGAQDERFALVISNNSGCGGAALSRRCFGETIAAINTRFPHWFCRQFRVYNNNESALPVDQHMLLALIAPRPLYVASAVDDLWADPKGEFLGAHHASAVYEFLGHAGLPTTEMPQPDQPQVGTVGYHIRTGGHDVTLYDWERFMDFADIHLP